MQQLYTGLPLSTITYLWSPSPFVPKMLLQSPTHKLTTPSCTSNLHVPGCSSTDEAVEPVHQEAATGREQVIITAN